MNDQETPKHPGAIWREIIEGAGVTQVWVAGRMGISSKHLNQILRCRALPTARLTVQFARAMNASAHKIWNAQARYEIATELARAREAPAPEPIPPAEWVES